MFVCFMKYKETEERKHNNDIIFNIGCHEIVKYFLSV